VNEVRDKVAGLEGWTTYTASNGLTVWEFGSIDDGTYTTATDRDRTARPLGVARRSPESEGCVSNQHDQDRDRIAEALRDKFGTHPLAVKVSRDGVTGTFTIFDTIDAAIAAFETLCEPKGWSWHTRLWHNNKQIRVWVAIDRVDISVEVESTGNHAADVCRLVCEVLDREAKPR